MGERVIMSREILFKAKRKDNGEWVEGYVVAYPSGKVEIHKISKELPDILLKCEIAPSTLCQYTGLTDKNDKKIWENDILRYSYDYDGSPFLKDGEEIKYRVGAVFWSEWRGSWAVCGRGNKKCTNNDVFKYNRNPNRTEVIGNIFDNPELMILFCPDLTGKEEVKAMFIGNGDFVRPVLHPCIKEKCIAYKDGKCMKYDNEVEVKDE